jgi:hypothetical protein
VEASETAVVLTTLPQFASRSTTRAIVSGLKIGFLRFLSTLQLSVSVVVSKTTPTQVPAPWLALTVSQRRAHSSGVSLVIQVPRKLLSP